MPKLNFYSGPAILPETVKQQAIAAIHNFAGTGLSILEISHRAKPFVEVMEEARALTRKLMGLNDEYSVLFLQGGASSQFYMIPYNLLRKNETAIYFDTGTWAHGALIEAQLFGKVHVACSSKSSNYNHIPKEWDLGAERPRYAHITTNNTIYGTQWSISELNRLKAALPKETLLVADMSSDIFSRQIDYSAFDLIYAGAQKNMGIAGATMVAVRKSILRENVLPMPKMVDYKVHIENDSMKNTPSVFAVYVSWLTLKWIAAQGIENLSEANERKAMALYHVIDQSGIFKGTVNKADRSMMNVCFVSGDAAVDQAFLAFAKQRDMVGLEGHRSVGGFRASIYNAMPESGVQQLIAAIRDFEKEVRL
ncbi:MAG: 3-phosphoserine/phosphohydroxythreonine transaminase [Chitinophagales bacterium]